MLLNHFNQCVHHTSVRDATAETCQN